MVRIKKRVNTEPESLKKIKEDRGITPSQNEFCKDL